MTFLEQRRHLGRDLEGGGAHSTHREGALFDALEAELTLVGVEIVAGGFGGERTGDGAK